MSSYTTEIRFICEELSGFNESKGYAAIEEIISLARPKIFNFNYPIFDENYKSVLETKILKHFYTREIGLETYGLWKLKLNTRMNEIMPYYNKLYSSELIEFNPLYSTNLTKSSKNTRKGSNTENEKENEKREEHNTLESEKGTTINKASELEKGTSTVTNGEYEKGTSTVTSGEYEKGTVNTTIKNMEKGTTTVEDGSTSSLTHYDLYSDTPQGALNGLEDGKYLTNARKTIDNGGGYVTKTNSGSDTDNTTSTNSGKDTESVNVTNSGKDTESVNVTNSGKDTESVNVTNSGKDTESVNVTNSGKDTESVSITNGGKDTNTEDKSESVGKERNLNKNENTTDDYLENVVGYDGVNTSEMIMKYRETFLNIDIMIIRQLEDLFFLLW